MVTMRRATIADPVTAEEDAIFTQQTFIASEKRIIEQNEAAWLHHSLENVVLQKNRLWRMDRIDKGDVDCLVLNQSGCGILRRIDRQGKSVRNSSPFRCRIRIT
jgi:hypothetical protein